MPERKEEKRNGETKRIVHAEGETPEGVLAVAISTKVKNILSVVALAIGVIGVVAYGLSRRKSGDSPTPPAVETRTETSITLKGRVPISVNVPIPTYRVVMEVPAGAETTSVSRRTEPRAAAPRPAVPTPATPPTPPAPKKAETTKVLVLNGLKYSVEIKYRTEASPYDLGGGAGASRVLEPGEEFLIDGVIIGEVLTARTLGPDGKTTGTYHCRVIPGPGPVRMWHILEYTRLRK